MNTFTDTLEFSNKLKSANFTDEQASTLANAFKDQELGLVTNAQMKDALEKLELRMKLYNGATAVVVVSVLAAMNIFG